MNTYRLKRILYGMLIWVLMACSQPMERPLDTHDISSPLYLLVSSEDSVLASEYFGRGELFRDRLSNK